MSNSECEDDPDYGPEKDKTRQKTKNTRKSSRLCKKAKSEKIADVSSDDEITVTASRKKVKSPKKSHKIETAFATRTAPTSFTTGAFLVIKKEAQNYDSKNPPALWQIDGKALLQKFESFQENGMVKYKNTSVYTGWCELERDKYAVMKTVNVISNSTHKKEISLKMSEFKSVIADSD